jgi:hypothetical protein
MSANNDNPAVHRPLANRQYPADAPALKLIQVTYRELALEDATSGKGSGAAQGDLSAALINLRDAFMTLSLALKDWQFEANQARRAEAEDATRRLVQKVKLPRNPSF